MAAVTLLMAIWWITEAAAIALTALLPIALFPLLAIESSAATTPHYANHIVFIYVGGFIIALAMERWNLHRRVALETIRRVGTRPDLLILGFMVATAFLSMWISNTATTMMMLPIAMAVVTQLSELGSIDGVRDESTAAKIRHNFGLILLLAVAYSASVGGVGTLIGTPTTIAFVGFAADQFPELEPIAFTQWTAVGLPVVIVFLPLMWVYLRHFGAEVPLRRMQFRGGGDVIEGELAKLGPISVPEQRVLVLSALTAALWVFRKPIVAGFVTIPGWSDWFSRPGDLHDATVAMVAATVLCVLPAGGGHKATLMDWPTIEKGLPWGVMLLLGGGFAMASAMQSTGLAAWIGTKLSVLEGAPPWLLVLSICTLATFLTEITSNIAVVLMFSPVIAATAVQIGVTPYLLLIPMAVTCSFAFMLPVATPPNAIVFGSGWITIPRMARAGVALDILGLVVVPLMVYFLGGMVFGF